MTSQGSPGPQQMRASDVVAAQIRRLRTGRRLTAADLAARCQSLGATAITTNVIANIETRRRDVSVDDLLIFALALDVPPTHLLSPASAATHTAPPARPSGEPAPAAPPLAITPSVTIGDPVLAQRWLNGQQALPGSQEHLYYDAADTDAARAGTSTAPSVDAGTRLAAQFDREAANFVTTVRSQVDSLLTGLETAVADGESAQDVLTTLAQARGRLTSASSARDANESPDTSAS